MNKYRLRTKSLGVDFRLKKYTSGRFSLGSDLAMNEYSFRTKSLGVDLH